MAAIQETPEKALTCFLSATLPGGEITRDVRTVLAELGVQVRSAEDLVQGQNIGSSIVDAVLSTDFVCLILQDDFRNPAVWYEAGIAAGSQRPVLAVTDAQRGTEPIPFNPSGTPIIAYRTGSFNALRDSLRAYVRQVQPIAAQLKIDWSKRAETSVPPKQLTDHGPAEPAVTKINRQTIVEHLLSQGVLAATYSQIAPNKRVDAIIGFPALGDEFTTVILEVKQNKPSEHDINQVRDYMDIVEARLAMVVYTNSEGYELPQTRALGPIGFLLISANELLSWDYRRLVKELTRLRNQVVHSN